MRSIDDKLVEESASENDKGFFIPDNSAYIVYRDTQTGSLELRVKDNAEWYYEHMNDTPDLNNGYPVLGNNKEIHLFEGKAYTDEKHDTDDETKLPDGISCEKSGSTYVYTFDNVAIDSINKKYLSIEDTNVKIKLVGNNRIGIRSDIENKYEHSSAAYYGIYAKNSDVVITGSGSLAVYSNYCGIKAKSITFDKDFTGKYMSYDYGKSEDCCLNAEAGTVTIINGTFELNNNKTYAIFANKVVISGGNIKAKGGKAAIEATDSLTLTNMGASGSKETYIKGRTKALTNKTDTEYVTITEKDDSIWNKIIAGIKKIAESKLFKTAAVTTLITKLIKWGSYFISLYAS